MEPSVAIVILNWNGKRWLEQFLPSVVQTDYPNLQIVVGDNASTDDSVAFVKAHYPQIQVIVNQINHGYAGGYNEVLAKVEADYFILLNSDVEVPRYWIQPVIQMMEHDSKIAAAQPKVKSYNNKNQFEHAGAAGGFIDLNGFTFCRGRLFDVVEVDEGQYNQVTEVFWASGAALFIKRKAWLEVGGLDADLFAHMEEIDLCWRLKNLGYKIMYCPDAEIYHVGGGTLNASNPYKTYLNFRNNLIIMQKNLPKGDAFARIFVRFFLDFVAWLRFLLMGNLQEVKAISKAHLHFFQRFSQTSRKSHTNTIPLPQHTGVYRESIVAKFFLNSIRKFSDLPGKPVP